MSSTMPTRAASARSEPATDRPGFVAATRPHLSWLYSLARRLVGDPDTAEDLVQRCLLKAHRSYGDLDDLGTLRVWLKEILVDRAQDHWRAEGRGPEERSLHGPDDVPLYLTSTSEDPFPYSIFRVPLVLVLVHMEAPTTPPWGSRSRSAGHVSTKRPCDQGPDARRPCAARNLLRPRRRPLGTTAFDATGGSVR